jgi:hypothetical protein
MLTYLELELNASDEFPPDLSRFTTIVLHGMGLRALLDEQVRERLRHYLELGGRLLVLAGRSFKGTVMMANHFLEQYGILMQDKEYSELVCREGCIPGHLIASGVSRLYWSRVSPIVISAPARMIVANPMEGHESIVVCSGPRHNLFVAGVSGLDHFLCVGYPFHNGGLLASLLRDRE